MCLVKDYSEITLEIFCAALFISPSERNWVSRGREGVLVVFAALVCALHVGTRPWPGVFASKQ